MLAEIGCVKKKHDKHSRWKLNLCMYACASIQTFGHKIALMWQPYMAIKMKCSVQYSGLTLIDAAQSALPGNMARLVLPNPQMRILRLNKHLYTFRSGEIR